MSAGAPPGPAPWIRDAAVLAACFGIFALGLALAFAATGAPAQATLWSWLHAGLFYGLPGLAVLSCTRWLQDDLLMAGIWAFAVGVAMQPLWLTPLWMLGAIQASWLVPATAVLALAANRERLALELRSYAQRAPRRRAVEAAALGLFAALSAWLGALHPFATVPIDPHFGTQGSIVRNLEDGWPPMNQLLEGVPLSYNYALHLGLMALRTFWPVGIVDLVARIAPILFLEATVLVFVAFARTVLGMRWRYAIAAAVSVFWVVGYGPVNGAIYASVLPSASTYVVSSLGAFIAFLVALRFLAERVGRGATPAWGDASIVAALAFSVTSYRGQGGAILACVVAFALLAPLVRRQRPGGVRVALLAAAIGGIVAALWLFFTLGSGFSGTSFIEIRPTFTWLADQHAFRIVDLLRDAGLAPWAAGATGFVVIALLQAKFLAPGLAFESPWLLSDPTPAQYLLVGTSIAGVCGTMLTTAPGGSHFSFLHYATISMALLGALGLARLAHSLAEARPRPAAALAVVLTFVLALASAWDLGAGLARLRDHLLPGRAVVHSSPQVTPLLALLQRGDLLVPLVRPADRVPGIEAEWGMVYGVRFIVYGNLLGEYVSWKNRLQPFLARRLAAASRLDASAVAGTLDTRELEAIAATLSRPAAEFFVIAPAGLGVAGGGDLREVAHTERYSLFAFHPALHHNRNLGITPLESRSR